MEKIQNNLNLEPLTPTQDLASPTYAGEPINTPTATSGSQNIQERTYINPNKNREGINWGNIVIGALVTLVVGVLTVLLTYYLTGLSQSFGEMKGRLDIYIDNNDKKVEKLDNELDKLDSKLDSVLLKQTNGAK